MFVKHGQALLVGEPVLLSIVVIKLGLLLTVW
jgi:hypothetical protein